MDWKICKFFRKKGEPKSGSVRRKQPSSLDKIWDAMADGLGLMRHQLSRQDDHWPCSAEVYSSQTLPLDKSSFGYRTDLEVWSVDSTLRSCREPPRQADFGWPTMDEFVAIISKVIIYQLLQNSFFGMEQAEKSTKIIYQIQGCNITNVGGEIQTQNNQIANDLRKQTPPCWRRGGGDCIHYPRQGAWRTPTSPLQGPFDASSRARPVSRLLTLPPSLRPQLDVQARRLLQRRHGLLATHLARRKRLGRGHANGGIGLSFSDGGLRPEERSYRKVFLQQDKTSLQNKTLHARHFTPSQGVFSPPS